MTRRIWLLTVALILIMSTIMSTRCAGGAAAPTPTSPPAGAQAEATQPPAAGEAVQFDFWAAPNPPQEAFWSEMADQYMADHPNVTINVSAMPESPSSEAGIQAAIAGGTAPAASENIFIGFGGELFRSDAIVPLNEMEGWQDILEARNMQQTVEAWQFQDGNYYILPIYSNAMLFGWRTDILSQLGIQDPPQIYSGVLDMGQQLKDQFPDKFVWARPALASNTWWERWFDFFMLYDAASGGQPLITGNEITADDDAAIGVLTFLSNLAENDYLLTQEVQLPFENGVSVMSQLGPWTFPSWAEQFPELQYQETFDLTMPPAPEGVAQGDVKTFADAKGLVLYAQASDAQRQAAWDFIRWVFSDPQHDLQWLQRTNLPPARDDLADNEAFQSFFQEHPELVPYAQNIPNAVPPLAHPEFTEIQTMLGDEAVVPVVRGEKEPEQAWNDWKSAVQSVLQ
jgi:multiple sugar transport system substrate-binding protein